GYIGDIGPLEWIRNLQLPVAFLVILVVLWVKPAGLWGTARVERV
ncbi:MAG: hypothetical protein GY745_02420, partial [Actinomycetia bacterium]|nr:hypothetical protein [Actinomycetes bacterium]MCP3855057.1 hypothetical protein [Actinomycetes bacterium]MCP3909568.1 hypothetical protein [Actinomycetes bacterium]MCP3909617.1 hypothetical protein [Actinomycetes bacterium]MCP4083904.1 hypothetical protein [Actinomycetes bacterium]